VARAHAQRGPAQVAGDGPGRAGRGGRRHRGLVPQFLRSAQCVAHNGGRPWPPPPPAPASPGPTTPSSSSPSPPPSPSAGRAPARPPGGRTPRPATAYSENWQYAQFFVGSSLAKFAVAFLFIPAFYRYDCTTIYEFLLFRFGQASQVTGSIFFFITRLLGSGVRLMGARLAGGSAREW